MARPYQRIAGIIKHGCFAPWSKVRPRSSTLVDDPSPHQFQIRYLESVPVLASYLQTDEKYVRLYSGDSLGQTLHSYRALSPEGSERMKAVFCPEFHVSSLPGRRETRAVVGVNSGDLSGCAGADCRRLLTANQCHGSAPVGSVAGHCGAHNGS